METHSPLPYGAGGKTIQALDEHHFEQNHRVDAGADIVPAVQWFHNLIQPLEIHRRIYFPQKMLTAPSHLCQQFQ